MRHDEALDVVGLAKGAGARLVEARRLGFWAWMSLGCGFTLMSLGVAAGGVLGMGLWVLGLGLAVASGVLTGKAEKLGLGAADCLRAIEERVRPHVR